MRRAEPPYPAGRAGSPEQPGGDERADPVDVDQRGSGLLDGDGARRKPDTAGRPNQDRACGHCSGSRSLGARRCGKRPFRQQDRQSGTGLSALHLIIPKRAHEGVLPYPLRLRRPPWPTGTLNLSKHSVMNVCCPVMSDTRFRAVRQVAMSEPILLGRTYDYVDAFVVDLVSPDHRPPEAWVRDGLAATPAWVERVARLIGVHQSADPVPGELDVFRIVSSDADAVHLEKPLPLLDVDLVGRNVAPGRRMLSTGLTYRRPLLARIVWAVVGPGHRWAARRVLSGAPSGSTTDGQSAGG